MMKSTFSTELPGRFGHVGLLIFRVLVSCLMLTHGVPKLQRLFSGEEIQFADPYGLGVVTSLVLAILAEFGCSILIMLGLATRLATIPLMVTMSTAIIFAHENDPFGVKEKPLLFLVCYILLFMVGAGKFSLDNNLSRR